MNWIFMIVILTCIVAASFLSIIFLIYSICEYKASVKDTKPLKPPKEVLYEDADYEQIGR